MSSSRGPAVPWHLESNPIRPRSESGRVRAGHLQNELNDRPERTRGTAPNEPTAGANEPTAGANELEIGANELEIRRERTYMRSADIPIVLGPCAAS
jgi:hypothetical protein